ncbi:hypothetical protein SAMN02745121_08961 [Nannocystis exedens]|uniref:Uncharacterized protein n=2 Tax=Nannocystis exedens TaxID=54 RepID=A0A1I2IWT6_9BACT|nr:hypothetical protein NAEX_00231 [Nannocystis exedens]SFF45477.1 hypothetical protein SAMN02745121_08961 [Nannocystis exedens]
MFALAIAVGGGLVYFVAWTPKMSNRAIRWSVLALLLAATVLVVVRLRRRRSVRVHRDRIDAGTPPCGGTSSTISRG